MEIDPSDNTVKGAPSFVYGGLEKHSVIIHYHDSVLPIHGMFFFLMVL